jgi:lysophospholipase L1-like esterase
VHRSLTVSSVGVFSSVTWHRLLGGRIPRRLVVGAVALVLASGFASRGRATESADTHWIGTWATAPVAQPATGTASTGFTNQTLRQVVRVSAGGREIRVRFSNAFGTKPVRVGAAHVALRDTAAAIKPGSDRPLTFGGSPTATMWPGALLLSDPVLLDVAALQDLSISLYLPDDVPASLPITFHGTAKQTNYISPSGNHASTVDMPVASTKQSWYFVSSLEVLAPKTAGVVVALGDSLTDANVSTPDTNSRWPNALAKRLAAAGMAMGVMNAGTGGGRLLRDGNGDSGLRRFDRDVLAQPGVTHVIVLLGINDIRRRPTNPDPNGEIVTADEMIAGYKQLILRAHARGIKIYGSTILPFENETFVPGAYTKEGDATRLAVNAWMRSSHAFDALIDLEQAMRDPAHTTRLLPTYDSEDHLHPNDAGYLHMGEVIDLALFK